MQDIHSIGKSSGPRLFGGAGDADRRLRQHQHHIHGHHTPQALKCPRCDSSNTKFCYYNNYNLSQPRHFCKSCRRYWTKGGVLRNVPVGGGCRKTKRSKPKNRNTSHEVSESRKTANSNSSSDSSSLTGNTTAPSPVPVPAPAPVPTTASASTLINFEKPDTQFLSPDPNFNPENNNTLFSDIGTFTSLITSSTTTTTQLPFSPFKLHHESVEKSQENEDWTHGDVLKGSESTSPLGFMDGQNWSNGTDQGLFDLTHHESYWSTTQWDDHAHENDNQHEDDHQLNYLR